MSSDSTDNDTHPSKRRKMLPLRYQNQNSSDDDENLQSEKQYMNSEKRTIRPTVPPFPEIDLQRDSQVTNSLTTWNKNATIHSEVDAEVKTEKSQNATIQSKVNTEVNAEKSKSIENINKSKILL